MLFLFVLAESVELTFTGQSPRLLCGVMAIESNAVPIDWMYLESENAAHQKISVNGYVSSDRYEVDGSSLVINEVKASDAGIYICGHGSLLYDRVQLNVTGM